MKVSPPVTNTPVIEPPKVEIEQSLFKINEPTPKPLETQKPVIGTPKSHYGALLTIGLLAVATLGAVAYLYLYTDQAVGIVKNLLKPSSNIEKASPDLFIPKPIAVVHTAPKVEKPVAAVPSAEDTVTTSNAAALLMESQPHLGLVRVLNEKTNMRAGPGLNFPTVAIATKGAVYRIQEWDKEWFKIVERNQDGEGLWVRNDNLKVVTK